MNRLEIKEGTAPEYRASSDYETRLMLHRLIPSAGLRDPQKFPVHAENTRIIRMIMREFPFQIADKKAWLRCLNAVRAQKKLARKLAGLKPAEISPATFSGTLLPFQKLGLSFLLSTSGQALLADEMGLGKTVQTLAFLSRTPDSLPAVVVAPLVTLWNWKSEIRKFLTPKKPYKIKIIRRGDERLKPADFYLINYELANKQAENLLRLVPHTIIYDEIQNLRNTSTAKYGACLALARSDNTRYRIGLSGTPVYNRGLEMYGIADLLYPGILGERAEFVRKYCLDPSYTEKDKRRPLAERLSSTIMLRRKKVDVLRDLPAKTRLAQRVKIDTRMYESQLEKLYGEIADARAALESGADPKAGLFALNKRIREMRLEERQIAGLSKAPFVATYLRDIMDDYTAEKFVVFAHHRSVHQVLFDALHSYDPQRIIGGQSDKERNAAIENFMNGPSRVIICGLRAGNVGISLTSASYVIFAELDWSPAVHRQAEDRLHRMGQKSPVFAHYLVGEGTFDEHIAGTLVRKTVEISNTLGDEIEHLDNTRAMEMLAKRFGKRGVHAR